MTIKTIGIMTGNSLDAVDAVLTSFDNDTIKDMAHYTLPYPKELTQDMLELRRRITEKKSVMSEVEKDDFFHKTLTEYTRLVATAVNNLCMENNIDKKEIAAIGFHGQTCDHFPPSIAQGENAYTLQIADAQLLADLTDIPVIYDFRSDDIINGGEGAPLAPVHNMHLSKDLKAKGLFPVAFCNGGNTGNIAVISEDMQTHKPTVLGWDIGPFNHLADHLIRTHKNEPCDKDGKYGKQGKVQIELLEKLFNTVAINNEGKNFYLQIPPRSSDPHWYRLPETDFSFEDTLRTVEYLSAYTFFHTLSYIPENLGMPSVFLIFGGGWKNPLVLNDFKDLLAGKSPILKEHKELFDKIHNRFKQAPTVDWSDKFGYSGEYMEARIFADMAHSRIIGEPFSFPEGTGCKSPTVAGIFVLPQRTEKYRLTELFEKYGTANLIKNSWNKKWNRASRGWQAAASN